jgi:hypothetical protein
MSKIVIFSAANRTAAENFHTVIDGVPLEVLGASRMLPDLEARATDGRIRVWGMQAGERGAKRASWARVEPPAIAFFYTKDGFSFTATIWAKEPVAPDGNVGHPALSQAVWGDPSFELIGFLEDVAAADVTRAELKAALGYQPGYIIGRESVVPSDAIQDAVISGFGTAEAFRDAVVGHVGTPPLGEIPAPTPATSELGQTYRPEDEDLKANRGDVFRVDPDRIDRGTQAHRKTQNLLASHLESCGLAPRSRSGPEPPYDLAWEDDGAIFVAEIKSLTDLNEERQLRLALGQILRYEQLLAALTGKPIRKVIAVEREPERHDWVDLCASHNIELVWPETFTNL